MTKMRDSCNAAYKYLMNIPLGFWSTHAFDTRVKIDHCTNNLSESFNSWIEPVRGFSVLNIMEGIRTQIMQRIVVRRKKELNCTSVLMPRILSKVNELVDNSRRCRVVTEAGASFEVQDYNFKLVVNLDTRSCDCRRWDVSGLPCRHACAVISYMRLHVEDFIAENHTKAAYKRTYDMVIQPIPSPNFWPQDLTEEVCLPPSARKQPGRPPVNRIRHPFEDRNTRRRGKTPVHKRRRQPTCSKCLQKGHTCRKCPMLVSCCL